MEIDNLSEGNFYLWNINLFFSEKPNWLNNFNFLSDRSRFGFRIGKSLLLSNPGRRQNWALSDQPPRHYFSQTKMSHCRHLRNLDVFFNIFFLAAQRSANKPKESAPSRKTAAMTSTGQWMMTSSSVALPLRSKLWLKESRKSQRCKAARPQAVLRLASLLQFRALWTTLLIALKSTWARQNG